MVIGGFCEEDRGKSIVSMVVWFLLFLEFGFKLFVDKFYLLNFWFKVREGEGEVEFGKYCLVSGRFGVEVRVVLRRWGFSGLF